jgi:F-type H+-transporting ATPase subunit delta
MSDSSTVARPYARALFEIASSDQALTAWAEALAVAAQVVANDDVRELLSRPSLDAEIRADFVIGACADVAGEGVLASARGRNLLKLLAANGRLDVIGEIAAQFEALKARAENRVKVHLTTATAVDEKVAAGIATALEQRFGKKVELELFVDEQLLGGAVIRADDMVIDGSVKNRLAQLAATLSA